MQVLLISEDQRLTKLCSDILSELNREKWSLSAVLAVPAGSDADLHIWDYRPDLPIPLSSGGEGLRNHLFLVHRMDLGAFRSAFPLGEETVLLKPVTRATLGTYLEQFAADRSEKLAKSDGACADRDDFFQSLIEANLRLQEYDQDRTNFLARAVHDFRAPLTAISGYCGLFLAGSLGTLTEQQEDVLRRMQHSANRLFRLSSAMFDLSVNSHVEKKVAFERADMKECVTQAVHSLQPVLREKHIALSTRFEACDLPLYFETEQMEQVLVNLLDNACKFTPKHGAIEIRGYPSFWERRSRGRFGQPAVERRSAVIPAPNCYRVDVADSGPGIPEEHLTRIFEEYARYSGGEDRSGAGLGLAICRMILTRHNGRIWSESSAKGAVFSFVLPFHSADMSEERRADIGLRLEVACK